MTDTDKDTSRGEAVPFERGEIKKILVVRNDNLGDVICTTPAIEALRRAFPDAFIGVLVADYTREALEGNPYIDRIYSYEKAKHSEKGKLKSWWRQWKVIDEIRGEGFDLALGIRSKFSSSHAWLAYASGARFRVGHRPKNKGRFAASFFNIFVEDESCERHEVERALSVTRRIGVDIEEKRLTLALKDGDFKEAKEFAKVYPAGEGQKRVCLHITSRMEEDRWWPVESYVELIENLFKRSDVALYLNWLPKDEQLVNEILATLSVPVPPVFSSSGLKGFAAFLTGMDLLVTLEGGAMHIGAASGTPTIAIFGMTSAIEWAPWGEGNISLRDARGASGVSAREVLAACDKLLK